MNARVSPCATVVCAVVAVVAVTACHRPSRPVDTRAARGVSVAPLGDPALPALVKDGDAVFFVGNSFLGWHDRPLPEWVASLGRSMTPPVSLEVGSDIVFGNTPLAGFLEHPATQAALASRSYRVWVLQGEDYEPVDHKAAFHQAVRDFNRAIVASGGRTVLLMTWEFPWRPFIQELAASYDEIGRELSIPVIPAGWVFHDADLALPDGKRPFWLTADAEHPEGTLHQNEHGTVANTYATFALLTGRNPHGQRFAAPGNTCDDATLHLLSDLAFAEVAPRLQAIVGAPVDAAPVR
ncbi:MAG: hypothetical protein HYS27_18910 [Deltaproteobacteria bacterium]|nr:hypothetical protein [Deltaproteobacteria bacterium]